MNSCDIADWSAHQCRLVYFDFTVRGEGSAPLIQAVLRRWHDQHFIDDDAYFLWSDALEWRENGNLLPGWAPIAPRVDGLKGRDESVQAEEKAKFLQWHRTRLAARRYVRRPLEVLSR